jgi:pyridoxal phosphate enzyme (YggS family)
VHEGHNRYAYIPPAAIRYALGVSAEIDVAANLKTVRDQISAATERAGRSPASVRLVGASSFAKGVTPDKLRAALEAGLSDFGENRVQEAEASVAALGPRAKEATWHFIGHLQTNKAAAAIDLFDIIQSVDSLRLAENLSRRSGRALQVLLEVNITGEASKQGLSPGEVGSAVSRVANLPNLNLTGLMTIAPIADNPELVRPVFRELRELAEANGLPQLSMGMTDDFEVAIEEGATLVRIGRAIFGERP